VIEPSARPVRHLRPLWWLLAFAIFPVGPYVALWASGALSSLRAITSVALSSVLTVLCLACLESVGTQPLMQAWVVETTLLALGACGVHQYHLGARVQLWLPELAVVWRWLLRALLVLGALNLFSAAILTLSHRQPGALALPF
jgi:hypothetical protein